MRGDRDKTSFMPTFDEVMQEHAQLSQWGRQPKPSGLGTPESHTTYYGTGAPGPGLKATKRKSDVNF